LSIGARVRAQGKSFALGILCLAATNALGLAIPWLIKLSIDTLGSRGAAAHAFVVRSALVIAGFAIVQAFIRTWSRILMFNAGRNVEYELRRDVFAHLTRLPPSFYRQSPTGDVMSRLTNDLGAVRMLFGPGALNIANTAIVYVTGAWLMLTLNPGLTALALLPFPALILGGRAFSRAIYRTSRDLQDQLGTMSTSIQEDLAGIAVVKLYAIEDQRQAAFARLNDDYLSKALALVRTRGTLMPLFAVVGGMGTLIVLWAGGRDVIAGRMTVGELVAFNFYLIYMSWPTVALGWILSLWQRGVAAWFRVREILATVPDIADPAPGAASRIPIITNPAVTVRDLTVSYGERTILDGVSLDLPAGQTLAIVGRTASGKTTLVDAIARLIEIPRGTVLVGGHDVVDLPLAVLRGTVGYAPQEAFLFSATVAENIAFGWRDGGDAGGRDHGDGNRDGDLDQRARVERAALAAGLGRDIDVLPEGYDTMVGERGITLSGGQRQRVALARALCAEPRVLLLDDSLSSVDAQTEREILARLRPILAGRTAVLVSHRVAAVKDADQIVVLDAGRIVERGRHPDLVAAGGLYAALYREQLAEEALHAEAAS